VWPEPIATIGLEYLHHALPVVAFDVGGMSDWLRDGENGFSVPAWDLATLAERLDRLLGDGDLARRQGAAGQAQARATFDREGHLDALSALLTSETGR
jgi:glycosyltransferase involved in cell wall biosynthesis